MYILRLGIQCRESDALDAAILTDKQFVTQKEDDIRRRFGETNILVIGSPAVNLLARRINRFSPFHFDISDETLAELAEQERILDECEDDEDDLYIYHQCLEGIMDVTAILSRFVGRVTQLAKIRAKAEQITARFRTTLICQRCEGTQMRPIRYLLHKLDRPGIVDPHFGHMSRGVAITQSKDYGLISIFPNPFRTTESNSTYVIYVAGVHGPGTALGVKMLSHKQAFAEHPFGGVFEVNINQFVPYFDRIPASKDPRWESRVHTKSDPPPPPPTISYQAFLSSPKKTGDVDQAESNRQLIVRLTNICTKLGIRLRIEDAYSFPFGVGDNFWQMILDYERKCDFVIHDVTGFARGVMVEVGFSFGSGRRHFLIRNGAKISQNEELENRSKLLQVKHVETIDFSHPIALDDFLERKIVSQLRSVESIRPQEPELQAARPRRHGRTIFAHVRSPQLLESLRKLTKPYEARWVSLDDYPEDSKIARVRDALLDARYVFVELDDSDPDAFIVLGLAKAQIGSRILPIRRDRIDEVDFAWGDDIARFTWETIDEDLKTPVAKVLAHNC
jgi:hypothetical protein